MEAPTISVGELRQNPTQMLRDVQNGVTYVVTNHGSPVADISKHQAYQAVPGDVLLKTLASAPFDPTWPADLADDIDEPGPWDE